MKRALAVVAFFAACVPQVTGAPCTQGLDECPTGQFCDTKGVCQPLDGGGVGGGTGGAGGAGGGTGGAGGNKGNGTPCMGPADCMSNVCDVSFIDGDHDGHGTGQSGKRCGAPNAVGNAPVGDDCCDTDNRAFPGQMQYFSTARTTCGGFDFNCNGNDEPEPLDAGACPPPPPMCNNCANYLGWAMPMVPACGAMADQVTQVMGPSVAACKYTQATLSQGVAAKCR